MFNNDDAGGVPATTTAFTVLNQHRQHRKRSSSSLMDGDTDFREVFSPTKTDSSLPSPAESEDAIDLSVGYRKRTHFSFDATSVKSLPTVSVAPLSTTKFAPPIVRERSHSDSDTVIIAKQLKGDKAFEDDGYKHLYKKRLLRKYAEECCATTTDDAPPTIDSGDRGDSTGYDVQVEDRHCLDHFNHGLSVGPADGNITDKNKIETGLSSKMMLTSEHSGGVNGFYAGPALCYSSLPNLLQPLPQDDRQAYSKSAMVVAAAAASCLPVDLIAFESQPPPPPPSIVDYCGMSIYPVINRLARSSEVDLVNTLNGWNIPHPVNSTVNIASKFSMKMLQSQLRAASDVPLVRRMFPPKAGCVLPCAAGRGLFKTGGGQLSKKMIVAGRTDVETITMTPTTPGTSVTPHSHCKSYKCVICSKAFSRSDMLTRHMRLHTGVKPYECHTCGQLFSRSDHLSTHKRTHTGEKPYHCPLCAYAASRKDLITRHVRTHNHHRKKNSWNKYFGVMQETTEHHICSTFVSVIRPVESA